MTAPAPLNVPNTWKRLRPPLAKKRGNANTQLSHKLKMSINLLLLHFLVYLTRFTYIDPSLVHLLHKRRSGIFARAHSENNDDRKKAKPLTSIITFLLILPGPRQNVLLLGIFGT